MAFYNVYAIVLDGLSLRICLTAILAILTSYILHVLKDHVAKMLVAAVERKESSKYTQVFAPTFDWRYVPTVTHRTMVPAHSAWSQCW